MDLLNTLLLVFCVRYFYYYCCCCYYNYYWFVSRLLDTIIRKQLFSNDLNFIFLINIDLTRVWLSTVMSLQVIITRLVLDALKISQWRSRNWVFVFIVLLYDFAQFFFIRKKLFEGSLRVDLPILLWFVFVLVDSFALNFIFIYIPYRCKSKAYSASHIIVYFAINNSIGCRGKNKLIIIVS